MPGDDGRSSYRVDATSIDDFFAERPKTVDVIKMDVQGTEPFALRGMREVLQANQSLLLFTELAPGSLGHAGTSAQESVDALNDAGFDLHVIDEAAGTVQPTTAEQLLGAVDFGRENHVNLLCSKGDAITARLGTTEQIGLSRAS